MQWPQEEGCSGLAGLAVVGAGTGLKRCQVSKSIWALNLDVVRETCQVPEGLHIQDSKNMHSQAPGIPHACGTYVPPATCALPWKSLCT
jgi:hypothetical protein